MSTEYQGGGVLNQMSISVGAVLGGKVDERIIKVYNK